MLIKLCRPSIGGFSSGERFKFSNTIAPNRCLVFTIIECSDVSHYNTPTKRIDRGIKNPWLGEL
ncbi:MAG: hypothetical protein KUG55_03980 [Cycloclasticus sp.]|jgi:hypothetical protein|nr:hypothetical protein [Cycloclasticus sp.]MDF1690174.1 hypothetical protein [Cycloclasticus sp.]MEE4291552.1 hypothetical protein [Cycloclasticus sp.]